MKRFILLILTVGLLGISFHAFADDARPGLNAPAEVEQAASVPQVDAGDTAWVLISSALVMLMTPGLALFYGGMVRRKNV